MTTARIGAVGVETLVQPDGNARIGAIGVESLVQPAGLARVGAIGVEVMVQDAPAPASGLKLAGEPIYTGSRRGRHRTRIFEV